ncbi:MAG: long-chain fatty acid--CoA ligase [Nitrospiria bacterium]
MQHDIVHYIAKSPKAASDAEFDDLALRLFQYQYIQNPAYQQFCRSKKIHPEDVTCWDEIPPLPVLAFKWAEISCRPNETPARIFYSSGTTGREKSRHAVFDVVTARAAILAHFKRYLLPDCDQIRMMFLTPSPEEEPHASLSFMMSVVCELFGAPESRYYIQKGKLQSEKLMKDLSRVDGPVMLLGTSFSFVHLMDDCERSGLRLKLPKGSRLMDTGGLKGKSRAVPQGWIYEMAEKLWDISSAYCVNEYGMSEMTSQFYDCVAGVSGPRVYAAPPQVKTRVLSPETLKELPDGETGLLAHTDLANIDSVASILTEDLGKKVSGGFVLLGRAEGAEAKGCSITMDALLANQSGAE